MKENENEDKKEEIENEQINNIDNLIKDKDVDKDDLDIDQINNIENLKNVIFTKEESFSNEGSFDQLNQLFGKYPYGIESLIAEKSPDKEDVFLVLAFNSTTDFIKKYSHSAKRKSSYTDENDIDEKEKMIEMSEEPFNKNENFEKIQINYYNSEDNKHQFLKNFDEKIKQTHNYIQILRNVFKELNKASDNLIEKIIIYYAKRVSEKMIKDNIDYYNICSNELKNYFDENKKKKIDYSFFEYYYELTFEDFIIIFSCIVHYYTGIEVKLEIKGESSQEVYLLLFCNGEETYEKLAESFGYELQLKPYALNYKEPEEIFNKNNKGKTLNIQKQDSFNYSKTINIKEISDLKLPSVIYEYQINEKKFMYSPPYRRYDRNKESKFRRYLPNDSCHICKNDPDFSRDSQTSECHRNCSKFRTIDKFRLIHKSLHHIMAISYLYKSGLLKMIINKRNELCYQELNICKLFFNLIKFGKSDYLITINKVRNFFGETVAFYFLWIYYYSMWSLPTVIVGIILYFIPFLKQNKQSTVKEIVNFVDDYDLPSIIFGLFIIICIWFFLKAWEQKQNIFRYLWGVEIKESSKSISEYFIPDNIEKFILGENLLVSSYYSKLKRVISFLIIFTIILVRIYIDYLIYNPYLLKDRKITNFIKKFQIWMPLIIKPISLFNSFICNKLSIWENNETTSKQKNSFAWKLILLEFFNYYTTLVRVAIANNRDYQQQMKNTIYLFLALDLGTYILEFLIELIKYLYKHGTLRTYNDANNRKKKISSTLEHQINSSELKNIIIRMNQKMIRFGYLCIFSSQATLTPLIIFLVNLIETFIDLYQFFILYRVEIIEKARGIGVYNHIIKTLFFVGMLVNVGLVFFHRNERENFVTIIFIIVVFENIFFFINLLNINLFLPLWYMNLSEIKWLYDKKYYSRDSNILLHLNIEKEEES